MCERVHVARRSRVPESVRGAWHKVWDLLVDMFHEFQDDSLGDQAAAMSFFTLLSIPAAALSLVAGLGSLEGLLGADIATDAREAITDYVETTFGSSALTSTVDGLFEENRSGLLTISLAVALFSLTRGFAGTVRGLDVAYDLKSDRSWIDVRLTGLVLAISTLAVVGVGVWMVYVVWPSDAGPLLNAVGVVCLLIGLTAWATTVLHYAPDHHTPWRYDLPGAVMVTLLWLVLIRGFAFYVRVADGGNGAVGVVGAALLAFTLIYLLNIVLLLGAELNAILATRAGIAQPPRRLHHRVNLPERWTRTGITRRIRRRRSRT